MNKKNLKLVKITEDLSDKIYDMFQEIPFQEDYQDINVANGLNKNEFRKYCVVLELASKNIMLDYIVPVVTWYVLFEKDEPIGWFLFRDGGENLPKNFVHSGHVGYTIRPKKRKQGYATEGLKLIIKKARSIKYKNLYITCDDKNIASQNLLKKLGFKKCDKNSKNQILTKQVYEGMSQYYLKL